MVRRFVRRDIALFVVALFIACLTPSVNAFAADGPTRSAAKAASDSGNPMLLPPVLYDSGGAQAVAVAVGDLNGDGIPDVVVVNQCASTSSCDNGTVGVFLGNGDGTFQPVVNYSSGGYVAQSVAIGDVNGDGHPDIIVLNEFGDREFSNGTVAILLGDGHGAFQPAVTYSSGGWEAQALAVADLNGNGNLDIVATNCTASSGGSCGTGDGIIGVLIGIGDGTFQPTVTYDLGQNIGTVGAYGITIGDVNRDGIPDLVVSVGVPGFAQGALALLLGNGNGTFSYREQYYLLGENSSSASAPAVADVNGDGIPDLLAASGYLAEVLLDNGNGGFFSANSVSFFPATVGSIAIADINGDGTPDLVLGSSSGPAVMFGSGTGAFQTPVIYQSEAGQAAVADLNHDGKLDVVATSREDNGDGAIAVLLNNRQGPPYVPTTTTLSSSPNPSARKQWVTYTATVTSQGGGPVTGSVTFQEISSVDGQRFTQTIGIQTLSGNQASVPAYYTQSGGHQIVASYSGDAANAFSNALQYTQYVGTLPVPTQMTARSSQPLSIRGQPVTFSAEIKWAGGLIPNGEPVTFMDGAVSIGTSATNGGVATLTTSSLAAGSHIIEALFAGNASFKPSQKSIAQVIAAPPVPTTTKVTSSGSPATAGQSVTFNAAIASKYGSIPYGEAVAFYDGATEIGSGVTSAGVATVSTTSLSVGTHHIKAVYAGDSNFLSSWETVKQEVVAASGSSRD
jgi:hypothetical protein